jgi:hypothetical protein
MSRIISLLVVAAIVCLGGDPTPDKQLSDAKAEISALRKYIAETQSYDEKRIATLNAAYSACLGNPPTLEARENQGTKNQTARQEKP